MPLKKIFLFIFVLMSIPFLFKGFAFAKEAIVLSDQELDNVSAAGFDIDIDAVLAWRQAVLTQTNIAAVIAKEGNIEGVTINNCNNLNADSLNSQAEQRNIAVVSAWEGKIKDVRINNVNNAYIDGLKGLTQSNLAIVMAKEDIDQTTINNINSLTTSSNQNFFSYTFNLPAINNIRRFSVNYSFFSQQRNLAIVVSFKGEIKNTAINNLNNVYH